MDITNEQWQRIVEYIPKPKAQPGKSGRPPQNPRDVLNGILWILRTGAQWADLPERYPPKSTCHRRFQEWTESGVFAKILTALAQDLKERGGIDLSEGFIDGTFSPAKKGAMVWAKPKRAKEPKLWALTGPLTAFQIIFEILKSLVACSDGSVGLWRSDTAASSQNKGAF